MEPRQPEIATTRSPVSTHQKSSHAQVLKSSALIGASSVATIALGIIRTKAMAILLGPAGIGLFGLYGLIMDLTRSVAGLGISSSGVRQIAEAAGSGDARRLARTVTALRRIALITGALGSLLLLVLCQPVARMSFGDNQHAGTVAVLALAVFFANISAAQAALVQGMRRIADLARINVLGGIYGTAVCILVVYLFGIKSLAASLVCVAAMSMLTSLWYARKIKVERVRMVFRDLFMESSDLLKLGIVFMTSGLFTMGAAYLTRILLMRQLDVEAAGFYQAAWTLGGLYVGFIIQAMGADFYPRLTASANDNSECNRLVNEQSEVGLLLAGPGIIATLVCAPLVIHLFYSTRFGPAIEILRWICLGMLCRVGCWPLGFVVLAKGNRAIFFWAELISNMLLVGLVWLGILNFGLNGAGIGFFGMYVAYGIGIYWIVRRLSGFRWSATNQRIMLLFLPLIFSVFISPYVLPQLASSIYGFIVTLSVSAYSLRRLCTFLPPERIPGPLHKIFKLLRNPLAKEPQ